jgi:hypothetical protein
VKAIARWRENCIDGAAALSEESMPVTAPTGETCESSTDTSGFDAAGFGWFRDESACTEMSLDGIDAGESAAAASRATTVLDAAASGAGGNTAAYRDNGMAIGALAGTARANVSRTAPASLFAGSLRFPIGFADACR